MNGRTNAAGGGGLKVIASGAGVDRDIDITFPSPAKFCIVQYMEDYDANGGYSESTRCSLIMPNQRLGENGSMPAVTLELSSDGTKLELYAPSSSVSRAWNYVAFGE